MSDIWINAFKVALRRTMSDKEKIEIADMILGALNDQINDPDCPKDELGLKHWEITVGTS